MKTSFGSCFLAEVASLAGLQFGAIFIVQGISGSLMVLGGPWMLG